MELKNNEYYVGSIRTFYDGKEGTLYLSNHRLIFESYNKQHSIHIRLDNITNYSLETNNDFLIIEHGYMVSKFIINDKNRSDYYRLLEKTIEKRKKAGDNNTEEVIYDEGFSQKRIKKMDKTYDKKENRGSKYIVIVTLIVVVSVGGFSFSRYKDDIKRALSNTNGAEKKTQNTGNVTESEAEKIALDYVEENIESSGNYNWTATENAYANYSGYEIMIQGLTSYGMVDYTVRVSKTGEVESVTRERKVLGDDGRYYEVE